MALIAELRRPAQIAGEEGPGPGCDMGEEGGERVHWYDQQYSWHQPSLLVRHKGKVQART
jgi:hypothetical protein